MSRLVWAVIFIAAVLVLFLVGGHAKPHPRHHYIRHTAAPTLFRADAAPRQVVRHHHKRRHHHHHMRPASAPELPTFWSGGGSDVVQTARSQLGNGPVYGRSNLWCARFMNWVLARTGHHGTGSDAARSFASMPTTGMHVGAIAVMRHHVGVVSGVTRDGNPVVISGNHANRVREAVYPRGRIVTFVEAR